MRHGLSGFNLLLALGLALSSGRAATAAPTPSFLCTKATTWTEKIICASDRLADLDMELAVVYARLLRQDDGPVRQSLIRGQTQWWAGRSQCQHASEETRCLEQSYTARIQALKSQSDYPGDKPAYAPRIVQEASIKAADVGWARRLSEYAKAIGLCVAQSQRPISAVLSAWMEPRNELVGMWLQDAQEQVFLCLATRDGKRLDRIRPRGDAESAPTAGPVLHLYNAGGQCPHAVQVADAEGRAFGWLTLTACPAE